MKAILHYGLFTAQVAINEPQRDLWVAEPLEPTTLLDSEITLDEDYAKNTMIQRLHFQLASSPKIGELLEYRFVGRD